MVNLVLSSKLLSQVEITCHINSPRENGVAEVEMNNICEKQVPVFY